MSAVPKLEYTYPWENITVTRYVCARLENSMVLENNEVMAEVTKPLETTM